MAENVLILAPYCDGTDVGEAWAAHQWVTAIGQSCRVTLLTFRRPGRLPAAAQLPHVEVVEWPDVKLPKRFERLGSMLKPGYPVFYHRARRWIIRNLAEGRHFDVLHQLTPFAPRYPSPAAGLGVPFVIGPLAGSLDTPAGFKAECRSAPWFVRLRELDALRLRFDPLLRQTFASADLVVGVAPYVRDIMSAIPIRRFATCAETGIHDLAPMRRSPADPGEEIRLLHVGRGVRTKGLRDCIRALAKLDNLPRVQLVSAGEGEEIDICRREARAIGVADRVTFLGHVPRQRVEALYAESDIFFFPSFREPSGSVVFESMRHGLPLIVADRGGPAHIVDDTAGIRVKAIEPTQFAHDLAGAVQQLVSDAGKMEKMRRCVQTRVAQVGLWDRRVDWMLTQYRRVMENRP